MVCWLSAEEEQQNYGVKGSFEQFSVFVTVKRGVRGDDECARAPNERKSIPVNGSRSTGYQRNGSLPLSASEVSENEDKILRLHRGGYRDSALMGRSVKALLCIGPPRKFILRSDVHLHGPPGLPCQQYVFSSWLAQGWVHAYRCRGRERGVRLRSRNGIGLSKYESRQNCDRFI